MRAVEDHELLLGITLQEVLQEVDSSRQREPTSVRQKVGMKSSKAADSTGSWATGCWRPRTKDRKGNGNRL